MILSFFIILKAVLAPYILCLENASFVQLYTTQLSNLGVKNLLFISRALKFSLSERAILSIGILDSKCHCKCDGRALLYLEHSQPVVGG